MNNIINEDIRNLSNRSYWERLHNRKILITGATGMLGAYLAYAAAKHSNAELFLLCRNQSKARELFADIDCNFIFQDVREPLTINEQIDFILHTAGPVGPSVFENTPVDVISANVTGTLSLLDYARGHNCKGFVFASTHEVYGAVNGEQVEENTSFGIDITAPRSCYVLAKQTAENALACAFKQYGLRTLIARFSRLYGPLMNLESGLFICDFTKNKINNEPIHIHGGLNLLRPLLYISDAADAMLNVLANGQKGEAYNAQGDEITSIGEIAGLISEHIISDKPETKELPPSGHWLNCDKLKSLGWKQTVPLTNGIKRTIEYFEG